MAVLGHREVLKKLRRDKGLTQRELADAIGISRQSYSDLESGSKAGISDEQLVCLAMVLGCTAEELNRILTGC